MTEVSDLDEALAANGETIVMQRLTLGPGGTQIPFSVTCRALVRDESSPDELITGGVAAQVFRKIILSPTEITQADWPGPMPVSDGIDKRVPGRGDRIIRNGLPMTVQIGEGFYVSGGLVRIEVRAWGS